MKTTNTNRKQATTKARKQTKPAPIADTASPAEIITADNVQTMGERIAVRALNLLPKRRAALHLCAILRTCRGHYRKQKDGRAVVGRLRHSANRKRVFVRVYRQDVTRQDNGRTNRQGRATRNHFAGVF